jgi:hypothetical protein
MKSVNGSDTALSEARPYKFWFAILGQESLEIFIVRLMLPWKAKMPELQRFVVPVERIELPTFGLQNRCSTAELNRRIEAMAGQQK